MWYLKQHNLIKGPHHSHLPAKGRWRIEMKGEADALDRRLLILCLGRRYVISAVLFALKDIGKAPEDARL
jgi:hypothetical protein